MFPSKHVVNCLTNITTILTMLPLSMLIQKGNDIWLNTKDNKDDYC